MGAMDGSELRPMSHVPEGLGSPGWAAEGERGAKSPHPHPRRPGRRRCFLPPSVLGQPWQERPREQKGNLASCRLPWVLPPPSRTQDLCRDTRASPHGPREYKSPAALRWTGAAPWWVSGSPSPSVMKRTSPASARIATASLPWGGKYPWVIEPRIHEILTRTGASVLSLAHVIAFQGTSWRRSVSIAPCLTTSLQSSLLCLSPTLVGMHLPTSTA